MNFRALKQTGNGTILVNFDNVLHFGINSLTKKVNIFTTVGVIEIEETLDEIKGHIGKNGQNDHLRPE